MKNSFSIIIISNIKNEAKYNKNYIYRIVNKDRFDESHFVCIWIEKRRILIFHWLIFRGY